MSRTSSPGLHVPYERLLERCPAPVLSMVSVASSSATPVSRLRDGSRCTATATGLAARLGALAEDGYSVTVCAEGAGSAGRLAAVLGEEGLVGSRHGRRVRRGRTPTRSTSPDRVSGWWWRRSTAGFVVSSVKVAVLTEADLTGRRRAHRPARPGRGRWTVSSTTWPRGTTWCTANTGGPVQGDGDQDGQPAPRATTCCSNTGATTSCTCRPDQIEALTPYSGGEAPSLNRLGGSEWSKTRPRHAPRSTEVAVELVELYRKRLLGPGPRLRPGHTVATGAR